MSILLNTNFRKDKYYNNSKKNIKHPPINHVKSSQNLNKRKICVYIFINIYVI